MMSDSTRYGVFFYRGSDEAEVSRNTGGCVCRALIGWVDVVIAVVCCGLVSEKKKKCADLAVQSKSVKREGDKRYNSSRRDEISKGIWRRRGTFLVTRSYHGRLS